MGLVPLQFWMVFSVNDSELRDIVTTLLGKRQPKTTKLRHRGFESRFPTARGPQIRLDFSRSSPAACYISWAPV
ncbi:hypothetical protein F4604DRAFT_1911928 [Suillus subluteus]|nr:hypothetical protein F4604DRAFT_1911928 [Suillus subluteus]